MSDLLSLAERVEGLDGPSREVDALVALACGIVRERDGDCFYGHRDHSVMVLERSYYDHDGSAPELPAYTASIDAAMTLVPEGRRVDAIFGWYAGVERVYISNPHVASDAATPALALCAAALRAKARSAEGGE